MTEEEIIKALEWCSELRLCVDCPMRAEGYFSHSGNACRKALMDNALALIKELTEKIDDLEYTLEVQEDHLEATREWLNDAECKVAKLTEENESLRIELDFAKAFRKETKLEFSLMHHKYGEALKIIKADTVRDFAERLKYTLCINNEENTEIFDYAYTLETIDQIAKEMIGE